MSNDMLVLGDGPMNLPAHLVGMETGVMTEFLSGIFAGGNRIGLRNSRFRLVVNGVEEGVFEENYLDVIFLGAAPANSRIYYEGSYKQGENAPPTCYSADGVTPADDVKNKQNDKCMTCKQNAKGSKIVDGQSYKACGYFRRAVVMLANDTTDRRVFKLDVKAQGLFGESSKDGKRQNLNDYIKMVSTRGIDVAMLVTRVSFDLDASVPKLMFTPFRYITPEEQEAVRALVASEEVKNLKAVTMGTVDLSGEHAEDTAQVETATPAASAAPAQTQRPAPQRPAAPAQQAPARPQPATPAKAAPQTPQQPAAAQAVRKDRPIPVEVVDNATLDDILDGLE